MSKIILFLEVLLIAVAGYCMYVGEDKISIYTMILIIWVRLLHMEFNEK